MYTSPPQPQPPVYQPPQPSWWNTGLAGIGGGRRSSYVNEREDVEDQYQQQQQQQSIPTIQIEQPNGYAYPSSPTHSGSSPTNQSYHRPRANSSIAAARNKLRIMAMLDDVRKKRELRDRRKSDIMAYLDDLIVPDDPAMANAAAGTLKLYRRRFLIYQFLNHPSTSTPWSITYHVMVFVIVFVCLILTICATIQQAPLQEKAIKSVYMLEKVVVVWFNIEFGLGIWSCACKKRYRGLMGKVRYLTIPSRLIDFVILSFTTIVLIVNPSKTGHEVFVVSAFRGFHRFFQVAQVLTLNRPLKPWKVLASVIYDQREQLFIIYYTEFIVLCVLAYVAFLVERDTNDNFNSIADAMWWA
ncbi:potassium voltage-gated channel subfamily KQT member 5-like protein, partial [Euroglyphus maynei]